MITEEKLVAELQKILDSYVEAKKANWKYDIQYYEERFNHIRSFVEVLTGKVVSVHNWEVKLLERS